MRKDERISADVNIANSTGYRLFWLGIFGVLIYRWFILDQSLTETLDIFIVWLFVSIVQFLMMALRGVPVTYPVEASSKEQYLFFGLLPLFTGFLTVGVLYFLRDVNEQHVLVGGFLGASLATLFLLALYKGFLYLWERRNL